MSNPMTPPALGDDLAVRFTHDDQPDASSNRVTGPDYARREVAAGSYAYFIRRNATISLQTDYELGGGWSVHAVLARQKSGIDVPPPVAGSATFLDVFACSTETSFEPKHAYQAPGKDRTNAVFGAFVFSRDRIERGRPGSAFPYGAPDEATTRSLFADARWQLAAQWDLLAVLRVERERQKRSFSGLLDFDKKTNALLPKIGVDWQLNADHSFGAVAYRGYQLDGIGPGGPADAIYLNAQRVSTRGAAGTALRARGPWLCRGGHAAHADVLFGARVLRTGRPQGQ